MKNNSSLLTCKFAADKITPFGVISALEKLYPEHFLLESYLANKNKSRYSVIGLQSDKKIIVKDDQFTLISNEGETSIQLNQQTDPYQLIEQELENSQITNAKDQAPYLAGWYGYFGYGMVKYIEKIELKKNKALNIAECYLVRPKIIIIFDNFKDELTLSAPIYPDYNLTENLVTEKENLLKQIKLEITENYHPALAETDLKKENKEIQINKNTSDAEYAEFVKKSIAHIKAGDVFQIVPSRRYEADFPYEPLEYYRALRGLNPSPFLFYFNFADFIICGSSPEIMVKVADNQVTIRPLAGTRPRGKDELEDKKLEEELLSDQKEVAEHLMLLDLGRNDVGKVAQAGSVKVIKEMEIERYSHVMHISSTVVGELAPDKNRTDALKAGFPAGTVSGAPKVKAMQILAKMEKEDREFYAGCIGYFSNLSNNMDMAITLRTALIKAKKIYIQSGAGVVYDSIPSAEAAETDNKAKALLKALNICD